jgi:tetratricopeptide (TPR) repeat protein
VEARRRLLIAFALAVACLLVFGQAVRFDFINYDDNAYVIENPHVRGGLTWDGVHWALTTIDYDYWQPLSWVSHMVDCQLFGLRPAGHHLVNVLLHTTNVLLVFAVLLALTGALWRSAAAAAIVGLHPLRLESVAWVAERKDLLGAFWFLAAIWLYLRYAALPSRTRYFLVLLSLALGLMSKPVALPLPFVLLLLDCWPLRRRAFAEKLPMFALVGVSFFITMIGTWRLAGINWGASLTLWQRVANALVSYLRYLELSVWPHGLAVLYPFHTAVHWREALLAALILAGITAAAVAQARRRPYWMVGWLWFAIMLLPASGLAQKGRQGMADRFTYLPHIGLTIAVVWGAADLLDKRRRAAAALALTVPVAFGAVTWVDAPVWRDSISLWANDVAVTTNNPAAHHYLAAALDDRGRYAEALPHHAEAVRLDPSYFVAQCGYGAALERQGDLEGAAARFEAALRYFPNLPDTKKHLEELRKALDLSKASGLKLKSER